MQRNNTRQTFSVEVEENNQQLNIKQKFTLISPPPSQFMEYTYSTSYFKYHEDYLEVQSSPRDSAILFGSKYHLDSYYDDIDKLGKKSRYYGRVLYPECRKTRGQDAKWSYENNMAFWAGLIDQNRPVLLLTDLHCYPKKKTKLTGTIHEILWLVDNHYHLSTNETYFKSNRQITAFVPPITRKESRQIINYNRQDKESVLNYFLKIKNEFFKKQDNKEKNAQLELSSLPKKRSFTSNDGMGIKCPRKMATSADSGQEEDKIDKLEKIEKVEDSIKITPLMLKIKFTFNVVKETDIEEELSIDLNQDLNESNETNEFNGKNLSL